MPALAPRHGFTLIEMAIVLVIIGLIVGGVLVGRELIRAAEIRATVRQIEQFNSAVNAFKSKYNCLPGDCTNASGPNGFGFSGINGNGNGMVGQSSTSPCLYTDMFCDTGPDPNGIKEYTNFWYHLSAAGLISFAGFDYDSPIDGVDSNSILPGIATPPTKIRSFRSFSWPDGSRTTNGGWSVVADAAFGDIRPGHPFGAIAAKFQEHSLALGPSSTIPAFSFMHFSPYDIQTIDKKIDDGFPTSGQARAVSVAATLLSNFQYLLRIRSQVDPYCVDDTVTPPIYSPLDVFCWNLGLVIKASF